MRLLIPEKILKRLNYIHKSINIERASILTIKYIAQEFYEVSSLIEIPSNAQLVSNENMVRLEPRFIKYIFRRSIEENIGILLVHNHPNIEYSRFSESDLSFEKNYYEFYKELGGKNIFGSMVMSDASVDIRLIVDGKVSLTESIEIILGRTIENRKGYILMY